MSAPWTPEFRAYVLRLAAAWDARPCGERDCQPDSAGPLERAFVSGRPVKSPRQLRTETDAALHFQREIIDRGTL